MTEDGHRARLGSPGVSRAGGRRAGVDFGVVEEAVWFGFHGPSGRTALHFAFRSDAGGPAICSPRARPAPRSPASFLPEGVAHAGPASGGEVEVASVEARRT